MKIIVVRDAPEEIRKLISDQFPDSWKVITVSAESFINEIDDADAIVPENCRIEVKHLERAKNLKFIQTGAGYDNVDIEECTKRGIQVANAAGVNARSVAEQVFAFIFCWYRNIINNVILTPHNAGEPDGLYFHKKCFQFFADNIGRVLNGRPPLNALNRPNHAAVTTIPEIILPEGYNGKILLISISGDDIERKVILRSGDLWHREILRATEAEIRNLGFNSLVIHQLGGAMVRFEDEATIMIYGSSHEC